MAQTNQYLTLGIDREIFAVPIEVVQEILDMRECAKLPQAPPFLRGMIDVRGRGIPVIDLRVKLGLSPIEATPRTRIVVLDVSLQDRALALGLVADCVFEVTDLDGNQLQPPPPSFGARWRSGCIAGIGRKGEGFVVVLNLDYLLSQDAEMLGTQAAIAA
jgi:purine-binding chemotaxis protein CheW